MFSEFKMEKNRDELNTLSFFWMVFLSINSRRDELKGNTLSWKVTIKSRVFNKKSRGIDSSASG